ncbi:SAM-dependent methyltransferase [Planctomicrobium piriforme]|uniref:Cyclopropane-fatty-acyl-phospholipid synthase n=1 Tax=Planctomicrobium piriforme TaxID=1576369 RepID=A0A1I3FB18_9PLAN|nr:cyclopropane-fatty-acyl-phospholipid synthase family protein [Planctomicrobium piriforme]SFI08396.1 cyclopropane-fatty-acyl-phospholipid synthase [Planctomicrobium piriforme]
MNSSVLTAPAKTSATARRGNSFWRTQLLRLMQNLEGGRIQLFEGDHWVGDFGASGPFDVTVNVRDPGFYRSVAWGADVAVGEGYIRGDFQCDDLTSLMRLLLQNSQVLNRLGSQGAWLTGWARRCMHWARANNRNGSRENIRRHYDLGNDFFQLWLDPTLAYSCGIFETPTASLEAASINKFEHICRLLDLQSGDHLLEIGCGWGGLAIHAARNYGCRVTGTTISQAQFDIATQRVRAAGLEDSITLVMQDYRDLSGSYDKVASVEMIEAVGHEFLDQYFQQVGKLVRPGGRFALQGIVMPEGKHRAYLKSVDFIQKYVFPGGCLPSISSMLESVGRTSQLKLTSVEDYSWHYAETLRRWRAAFFERIDDVRALGYPGQFERLWEYYLCYCEAAFEERATGLVQMRLDQPPGR